MTDDVVNIITVGVQGPAGPEGPTGVPGVAIQAGAPATDRLWLDTDDVAPLSGPLRIRWDFSVAADRNVIVDKSVSGYPNGTLTFAANLISGLNFPVPDAQERAIVTTLPVAAPGPVGNATSDSLQFDEAVLGAALTAAGANKVGCSITFRLGMSMGVIARGGTRPVSWPADVDGFQNWSDLATGKLAGIYLGGFGSRDRGATSAWLPTFPTAQYQNYLQSFIWEEHYPLVVETTYDVVVADAPVDLVFNGLFYAQNQHEFHLYWLEAVVLPPPYSPAEV